MKKIKTLIAAAVLGLGVTVSSISPAAVSMQTAEAATVKPGHFGSSGAEGFHDLVVVISGVGLGLGMPDHLLGVHALAVDDGADFPVGAACVKADAAAVHVSADGHGSLVGPQ